MPHVLTSTHQGRSRSSVPRTTPSTARTRRRRQGQRPRPGWVGHLPPRGRTTSLQATVDRLPSPNSFLRSRLRPPQRPSDFRRSLTSSTRAVRPRPRCRLPSRRAGIRGRRRLPPGEWPSLARAFPALSCRLSPGLSPSGQLPRACLRPSTTGTARDRTRLCPPSPPLPHLPRPALFPPARKHFLTWFPILTIPLLAWSKRQRPWQPPQLRLLSTISWTPLLRSRTDETWLSSASDRPLDPRRWETSRCRGTAATLRRRSLLPTWRWSEWEDERDWVDGPSRVAERGDEGFYLLHNKVHLLAYSRVFPPFALFVATRRPYPLHHPPSPSRIASFHRLLYSDQL